MQKLKLLFLVVTLLVVTNISNSQWFQQYNNPNIKLNDIFFINSSTGFAVGDSAIIIKTTNGGANWFTVKPPGYGELFTIKFINANTGWAGGGKHVVMNMYKTQAFYTTDGGNTWTNPFPPYFASEWLFRDVKLIDLDNVFFTSGQCYDNVCAGDIVKTSNRGQNWTSVTNVHGYYKGFNWINNQTGWAVTNFWNDIPPAYAHVLKTTNSGQNWNIIYTEVDSISGLDLSFDAIQFLDANNGYLLKMRPIGVGKFQKSSNSGYGWVPVDSSSQRYWDMFFININTGWISESYGAQDFIMKTTNGGVNWYQQYSGTGIVRKIFFTDANYGWALSGSTILHTTNGGVMGVKVVSNNTPNEFHLFQNHPNPFNPTTTIRYDIKTKSKVELKVFDLLGREITTLVNENQTPATYEVVFDATSLPSGVYFCILKAGDFVDSKKMILLK